MVATKVLSDYLSKLEEIKAEDLLAFSILKEDLTISENKLGNRILYSQVVPQDIKDLLFNSIIIRKIIEFNLANIYNKNLKRIDIPEVFLELIPDLQNLAGLFIDVIKPKGITTLCIKSEQYGRKNLGTLIYPDNLQVGSFITVDIKGQKYQIEAGSLVMIPISDSKANITFTSTSAKLLGKRILVSQVAAGKLGLIIDARI